MLSCDAPGVAARLRSGSVKGEPELRRSRCHANLRAIAAHDSTQFRYGRYGYWCDTQPGYLKYQVYARYWSGGSSTYAPSTSPSAPYCVSNTANTTFTKSTTTADNFSTGADTSGSIGIDLSSRTGYTSALKLVFKFTSTRQPCGTNDFPGGSNPKRLVATA